MSKRIYSATPGSGLDIQATLNYNQYFEVDEDGFSETKAIKSDVLLRTRPSETIDASGESEIQIAFDTYNTAIVTVTTNCEFLVYPKTNETCYIHVSKSAANIVTIGEASLKSANQIGLLYLLFKVDSINGVAVVEQLNSQRDDTLVIGNLTSADGTVTTFTYFKSTINGNMCSFEGSFIFTTSGLHNELSIDIANWDVTKYNSGYTSMNVACVVGGVSVKTRTATIKEDSMIITLDAGVISGAVTILLNGSFRVK